MTNSSSNTVSLETLVGGVASVVGGPLIGGCNLCIALSVVRYSALRQLNQYIFLMSLALADAFYMFGVAAAGFYRLFILCSDSAGNLLTPTECFWKPHYLIWTVFYPFSYLMLVILSLDQLLLVSFPSIYILSLPSPTYALSLVGAGLGFTVFMALMGANVVFSAPSVASESAICFFPTAQRSLGIINQIVLAYYGHQGSLAFGSVLIFGLVPLIHACHRDANMPEQDHRSQRRMTVTVAVSCMCTLCLYSIPSRMGYIAWHNGYKLIGRCLWALTMANPLANTFIYQLRHHEMRLALRSMFKCKQLPYNLDLWPKPAGEVKGGGRKAIHMKARNVQDLEVENLEDY